MLRAVSACRGVSLDLRGSDHDLAPGLRGLGLEAHAQLRCRGWKRRSGRGTHVGRWQGRCRRLDGLDGDDLEVPDADRLRLARRRLGRRDDHSFGLAEDEGRLLRHGLGLGEDDLLACRDKGGRHDRLGRFRLGKDDRAGQEPQSGRLRVVVARDDDLDAAGRGFGLEANVDRGRRGWRRRCDVHRFGGRGARRRGRGRLRARRRRLELRVRLRSHSGRWGGTCRRGRWGGTCRRSILLPPEQEPPMGLGRRGWDRYDAHAQELALVVVDAHDALAADDLLALGHETREPSRGEKGWARARAGGPADARWRP